MLKFYDREKEIALLSNTEQKSVEAAQMTLAKTMEIISLHFRLLPCPKPHVQK